MGFIATEMGHVFSSYGSEVTIFTRSGQLLKSEDADISSSFTEAFSTRVKLEPQPKTIQQDDRGQITVSTSAGDVEVDELLIATGRIPNSDTLELQHANIKANKNGVIQVDKYMETNVSGVWAIGDVVNEYQLKHVAKCRI